MEDTKVARPELLASGWTFSFIRGLGPEWEGSVTSEKASLEEMLFGMKQRRERGVSDTLASQWGDSLH